MAIPPTNPDQPMIEAVKPTRVAYLWRVLLITFMGSMGTAVVTNGIAFIADQGLGYSSTQNLVLGLVIGATYIPFALFSGPLLRKLVRRNPGITTRRVLLGIMMLLTVVAQGPLLADRFGGEHAAMLTEAALWLMGLVFMAATGVQWPIVEAYLSGGRRSTDLRKAIGKFNIVWSSAIVLVYWMMAPLLEKNPFLIVSLLGGLHIVIALFVSQLPDDPAKHLDEAHEPHPAVYVPLLKVFRMMLIASYVILSVMIPLMPSIETRLGLAELWWTPIASTWLTVRVIFFIVFERWHGWHGRWWTPWFGMGAMMLGFALAMVSPNVGIAEVDQVNVTGVILLVAGLSLAGVGIAATYYGALYYAMAVGNADVDAGGKHEAFIGVGYTVGPLCGLFGGMLWAGGAGIVAVTSVVVLTMVGVAIVNAMRHPKTV
tara:strand:+ start:176520 stop:177806 length:1287 start_codon:yes stop_codon:yes gene_type:complete